MDIVKWFGILVLSIVMGMVVGGVAWVAAPSVPMAVRIALEVAGALIVLGAMYEIKRIADTIETDHGKQFD
ncbi:MAG TPA: hypothetical protein VH020_14185 [Stellaceae bacterium]|jgi:hypothetical protein|nr:hypothetical protein [Stellaceae bacterium]